MQVMWVQSLGWKDTLEKEMATHPVFLPGEFYGQRSLVGDSPWGSKIIGHDLANKQTNHKIYQFKVYNSNVSSIFTELCQSVQFSHSVMSDAL